MARAWSLPKARWTLSPSASCPFCSRACSFSKPARKRVSAPLRMARSLSRCPWLSAVRQQLVQADLIAYQKPLYRVLALPDDPKCSVPRFFRELFPFGFVVKREVLARC